MALIKRSGKGSALTHTEMDANLTHLGGDGTYVMPATDGESGQAMTTNGDGQVSFTSLTGVTATISNAYPVGSIYMNCSNATNPGTLLGFGTWEYFGAGRVLVGLDSSDTDFDGAEETGGSKTHTLSLAEMPQHAHTLSMNTSADGDPDGGNRRICTDDAEPGGPFTPTHLSMSNQGSNSAHNNVQPYIVVYMWKRTA